MKPIFEPGDFNAWICDCGVVTAERLAQELASACNAKLSSLGIDAETPEVKRLERNIESISNRLGVRMDQVVELENRLAELERQLGQTIEAGKSWQEEAHRYRKMIAEAPVAPSANIRT